MMPQEWGHDPTKNERMIRASGMRGTGQKKDTVLKTLDITLLVSSVLLYGLYEVFNSLLIAIADGLLLLSWFIVDVTYSVITREWSELALDISLIALVGISAALQPRAVTANATVLSNVGEATLLGEVVLISIVTALAAVIIIRRAWQGAIRL